MIFTLVFCLVGISFLNLNVSQAQEFDGCPIKHQQVVENIPDKPKEYCYVEGDCTFLEEDIGLDNENAGCDEQCTVECKYSDEKHIPVDGKCPAIDGECPAVDGKCPAVEGKCPAIDNVCPNVARKCPMKTCSDKFSEC